jgi:hypothetical protein
MLYDSKNHANKEQVGPPQRDEGPKVPQCIRLSHYIAMGSPTSDSMGDQDHKVYIPGMIYYRLWT